MRKDKARDIARGVLPSTGRKGARDNKRNFHSRHRHAQRQANHAIERSIATVDEDGTLSHDPDLYDDFEDREIFDGYSAATKAPLGYDDDIKYVVSRRRDHDKLGPLLAWARATEKNKMVGWEIEDKINYFKAILPDNLQGRHALGHVKQALGLYVDPFERRYFARDYKYYDLEAFRADVYRCLATPKGRRALRDFLHETVPVAAHHTPANNKVRSSEHAVDENGKPRYATTREGHVFPIKVDVYVPQIVSTTCDDCTFLRNDPLMDTKAINRFIDIVWTRPRNGHSEWYVRYRHNEKPPHTFLRDIIDYVRS